MTMPSGGTPPGALAPGGFAAWQAMTEADAKTMMAGGTKGAFGGAQNAFKTNGVPLSQQLETINDHTQQITELREEFEQGTIWGVARTFTGNGTYLASPGTVRVEVIIVGGGAGGAMAAWYLSNSGSHAGGGGGGGETHFTIPGSLLFDANGAPIPIPVIIGAGGQGGQVTRYPGNGGGNTSIQDIVVGGGQGGLWTTAAYSGGDGGFGMIRGGRGGSYAYQVGEEAPVGANNGGDSISPYDMHGGGGGGGSGTLPGGAGGASPGGNSGHWNGYPPSTLLATGGGGGRGSNVNSGGYAGHGAAPGGGGGGGAGANTEGALAKGGNGGQGIAWFIERKG